MAREASREKQVNEESLFAFITEKAHNECQSLLEEADKEAARILASAREKADRFRDRSAAPQRQEAEQRLAENRARLAADRILAEAKGRALARAKGFLLDEVETWVDRPLYENALKDFLLAAAEAVGHDPSMAVRIYVSSKDKRRMQGLLKKHSIAYELEVDDTIQGGLIMESADGRWSADATIRTRLEQVWEDSLPELCRLLFEERPGEEEEEEEEKEEGGGQEQEAEDDSQGDESGTE